MNITTNNFLQDRSLVYRGSFGQFFVSYNKDNSGCKIQMQFQDRIIPDLKLSVKASDTANEVYFAIKNMPFELKDEAGFQRNQKAVSDFFQEFFLLSVECINNLQALICLNSLSDPQFTHDFLKRKGFYWTKPEEEQEIASNLVIEQLKKLIPNLDQLLDCEIQII